MHVLRVTKLLHDSFATDIAGNRTEPVTSYPLHVVGFHIITQWLLLQFFYATPRTFYNNYSIYILVFISLFYAKIKSKIIHETLSCNSDTG